MNYHARSKACMGGFLLFAVCAVPARAHMVSTGIGPFYDGVSHLFATPLDLLCVIASVLLGGMAGIDGGRHALIAAGLAWCAGVPLGTLVLGAPLPLAPVLAAILVLLGGMSALDMIWKPLALLPLLFAVNGLIAVNAGAGLLDGPNSFQLGLGMLAGVLTVLSLGTAFVAARPDTWQRIALRAAGSWLAAIGFFAFAWALRGFSSLPQ